MGCLTVTYTKLGGILADTKRDGGVTCNATRIGGIICHAAHIGRIFATATKIGGISARMERNGGMTCQFALICDTGFVDPYLEINPEIIWVYPDWSAYNDVYSNTNWNVD